MTQQKTTAVTLPQSTEREAVRLSQVRSAKGRLAMRFRRQLAGGISAVLDMCAGVFVVILTINSLIDAISVMAERDPDSLSGWNAWTDPVAVYALTFGGFWLAWRVVSRRFKTAKQGDEKRIEALDEMYRRATRKTDGHER